MGYGKVRFVVVSVFFFIIQFGCNKTELTQYEALKLKLEKLMGKYDFSIKKVDYEVIHEAVYDEYRLLKIEFVSNYSAKVPAYLTIPNDLSSKYVFVCLHQTNDSIGKAELVNLSGDSQLAFATYLTQKGIATISLDYPFFGENKNNPYSLGYISTSMNAIIDNSHAITLIQQLFPNKFVGLIGHSLGGHNALFTTFFDSRVNICISSNGFTEFDFYNGGDLTNWSQDKYMPRMQTLYSSLAANLDFSMLDIIANLKCTQLLVSAALKDTNFDVNGVKFIETELRNTSAKLKFDFYYPNETHSNPEFIYSIINKYL